MKYLTAYNKLFEGVKLHENELDVSYHNLYKLDQLPEDLKVLICKHNHLKTLPQLPESLNEIWCHNNEIVSLPKLPESLTVLCCTRNKLKSLPQLPESLVKLMCSSNELKSLPELPDNLEYLNCSKNSITILPKLPEDFKALVCDSNPLECLIPENFVKEQSNVWLEDYYYPMLKSYEGQRKILLNDILIFKELEEQLKNIGAEMNPQIVDEFSITKQAEWG